VESVKMNNITPEIAETMEAELMALSIATRFQTRQNFRSRASNDHASLLKGLPTPELERQLYETHLRRRASFQIHNHQPD
jgi:hypothetical protein